VPIVYVTIVPKNDIDMNNIDGVIQKPFAPKEFISQVKNFLK